MTEVVVVGAGPAGWALADHCARARLDTVLVAPTDGWTATYGLWTSQTPNLPPGSTVVPATTLWAGERSLRREYAVLDNDSVLAAYARTPVRRITDSVVATEHGDTTTVVLASGTRLRCRLVVDATGQRRVLSGGARRGARTEQTAFGMVFPSSAAAPVVARDEGILMRWDRSGAGWPTFLYSVPLPGDRVLLEETSLARSPGLSLNVLKHRLTRRLTDAGVDLDARIGTEQVRFAMDVPWSRGSGGVVPFGVAAGMMHPATGYSVGESLTVAPLVAGAIADALPRGAEAAHRAARAELWPAGARQVRRLRSWGLRTLLALPSARVPEFFDAFFSIPEELQHAYLCGRDDPQGTMAAMVAFYRAASWRLRAAMTAGVLPRFVRTPTSR